MQQWDFGTIPPPTPEILLPLAILLLPLYNFSVLLRKLSLQTCYLQPGSAQNRPFSKESIFHQRYSPFFVFWHIWVFYQQDKQSRFIIVVRNKARWNLSQHWVPNCCSQLIWINSSTSTILATYIFARKKSCVIPGSQVANNRHPNYSQRIFRCEHYCH